jgi:diadenylate cyclase
VENYLQLIPPLRWQDVADVAIVAYITYRILLLIKGTRAMQMVLGLGILGVAYVMSQVLGLFTLNWMLNRFLGSLIIILVVIFQADIRRGLTNVGSPFFGFRPNVADISDELAQAAGWLSAHRIGALVALERGVSLAEYIEAARQVDAHLSAELLENIFMPGSPLHDGAVIAKGDRILAAAALLPLSANPDLSRTLGTRHRAAIGLTEETDALVIVVSEEDGLISLANGGKITRGFEPAALRAALQQLARG